MSAQYQFRIHGLKEAPGQVKAATFQRVLEALLKTAERTARLLATGAGTDKEDRGVQTDDQAGRVNSVGFVSGLDVCMSYNGRPPIEVGASIDWTSQRVDDRV